VHRNRILEVDDNLVGIAGQRLFELALIVGGHAQGRSGCGDLNRNHRPAFEGVGEMYGQHIVTPVKRQVGRLRL
jgi:hypothetical protein